MQLLVWNIIFCHLFFALYTCLGHLRCHISTLIWSLNLIYGNDLQTSVKFHSEECMHALSHQKNEELLHFWRVFAGVQCGGGAGLHWQDPGSQPFTERYGERQARIAPPHLILCSNVQHKCNVILLVLYWFLLIALVLLCVCFQCINDFKDVF